MRIFPLLHDLWFSFSVCMFRKRLCYLVSQHIFFFFGRSIHNHSVSTGCKSRLCEWQLACKSHLSTNADEYIYIRLYAKYTRDSCCCGFNAKFANSWEHGLWLENGHRLMCIICEHCQILCMSVGDYLTKSDMNVILWHFIELRDIFACHKHEIIF